MHFYIQSAILFEKDEYDSSILEFEEKKEESLDFFGM